MESSRVSVLFKERTKTIKPFNWFTLTLSTQRTNKVISKYETPFQLQVRRKPSYLELAKNFDLFEPWLLFYN